VITPVFSPEVNSEGHKDIIFFTASRGHHADIGGILPGSMPPTSTSLREEGAEIVSLKLVNDGIFDKEGLEKKMVDEPARWAGSSGCRNMRDVESDLKAVRTSVSQRNDRTHGYLTANRCEPQGRGSHPCHRRRLQPRDGPRVHVPHPEERRFAPPSFKYSLMS
jgi:hypothetical protein